MDSVNSAAMVFEETASHKPLSSATWTDRSALVPKVPAPLWFSHQNAQTHRLRIQQVSAHLSNDPKNHLNIAQLLKAWIILFHFMDGARQTYEIMRKFSGESLDFARMEFRAFSALSCDRTTHRYLLYINHKFNMVEARTG